jgi:hypothetical protein
MFAMDTNQPQTSPADDPASAFAALRREVSLLRRAIEGLTAERQNAPDYTPTLTVLTERLARAEAFMGKVAESPAMRLTPENLGARIFKASETARAVDREAIDRATATLKKSISGINDVVAQACTADRQWKRLVWTALVALSVGTVSTVGVLRLLG